MKKIVFIFIILYLVIISGVFAQVPGDIIWSDSYGGNDKEYCYSMDLTTDGGYILGGHSNSFGTGTTDNDVYLVKIDAVGDTIWTRTYGDIETDRCKSVQQCGDGGYILAGETNSFGAGNYDVYLIKTDANGDTLWTKTYGGTGIDRSNSVKETTDGGYILTGSTQSFGAGGKDVYLIKTDANGDTLWTRTYGAVGDEEGYSVIQTTDGGYVIAGFTDSFGAGGKDAYLIKADADGNFLWNTTHGGTNDDRGYDVQQCYDGGYVIAGDTKSSGAGNNDIYLVKTDASGETLWTRDYGGSAIDMGYSLKQAPDEGYIIAGSTQSFDVGYFDIYMVRTDAIGDTLWTKTYGSYNYEHGRSVQITTDDNYVVAGWTWTYGPGISAFWLLKIVGEGGFLYPPENLYVDESIGLATWDIPLVGDLLGYNVYLDGVFIDFTTDLFWQYIDLVEGITYIAGVSAIYNEGESVTVEYEFIYMDPVFAPPENLYVDESIGLATWDAPSVRDLLGYNVYLDGVFINFTTDTLWQYTDLVTGTTYLAGVSATYDDGVSEIIEYEFTYNPPVFAPPENLYVDETIGLVTWDAPMGEIGFSDGFETYDDFVLEFDPWTLVDVDGCITYYIVGHTFPNQNYTGSYIIFNPSQVDPPLEDVIPHSGNKMAACFAASNPLYLNDDWMITPVLTINESDEVSFFAKTYTDQYGLERFNVAVSTTGTSPEDFTVISPPPYIEPPVEWTEYNFDLSDYAGQAVYVAIQCVSADAFIFFVDDFYVGPLTDIVYANIPVMNGKAGRRISEYISVNNTYESSLAANNADNTRSRDLLGYNIYLNDMGNVLAFVGVDVFEYQYIGLINGQSYVAGVSAVYEEEESEIVEFPFTYSGVGVDDILSPTLTELTGNYPNPFNPTTTISFSVKEAGHVSINIYNMKGQLVKTLVNEYLDSTYHNVSWNGKDNSSKTVSSGIYFYKMRSGKYTSTKKMILMK